MLLSEKAELEQYVERLDKSEFLAVLKFLLVTVIILPALPNQEYTQFKLNPARIWQIVIMVSSIAETPYAHVFPMEEQPHMDAWISKPVGPKELLAKVAELLGE